MPGVFLTPPRARATVSFTPDMWSDCRASVSRVCVNEALTLTAYYHHHHHHHHHRYRYRNRYRHRYRYR